MLLIGAAGTIARAPGHYSVSQEYSDEELYCSLSDPAGETEFCSRVLEEAVQWRLFRLLFIGSLIAGVVLVVIGFVPKLRRLRWE